MGPPTGLFRSRSGVRPRRQGVRRGTTLAALAGIGSHLFEHPLVACLLGAALGAALLYSGRLGVSMVDPDQPAMALAWVALSTLVRFTIAAAFMAAVFFFRPPVLVPFALCVGAGFFVMVNVELVRHAGMRRLLRREGW